MQRRYIELHVTKSYSEQVNKVCSYLFDHKDHNVELKNVGSKQMFLVSKESGENMLLIDADDVRAIDYNALYDFK